MRPVPERPRDGQESVWDYPRPAIAEPCEKHLKIMHRGMLVAETRRSVRTLETSHPPSYYFPRDDISAPLLPSKRRSLCEWKGEAIYFDVRIGHELFSDVAWSYPHPSAAFLLLRDHVAFYSAAFEACFVDGERVTPQAGGFYGGWITSDLAGPFKGGPGSTGW